LNGFLLLANQLRVNAKPRNVDQEGNGGTRCDVRLFGEPGFHKKRRA
jgi:hypothetical protein